jgi:basic membrane protein A
VYEAMMAGPDVETGINVMGVANEGVGYALDDFNAALITPEMQAAVDAAAAAIADGSLVVHDYTSDETCPALTF